MVIRGLAGVLVVLLAVACQTAVDSGTQPPSGALSPTPSATATPSPTPNATPSLADNSTPSPTAEATQSPTAPDTQTIIPVDVAQCDEDFTCNEPAVVEVVDTPQITVDVTSNGYIPDSNIILGTFNFFPQQALDPMLYELDGHGEVLRSWRVTNKHGGLLGDRRMLPNGNLLFTIFKDGVYEIDPDGNMVWFYLDSGISHHAEMLPNGNILAAGIYCDCVKEIDYETRKPVWEWYARDAFPNYDDDVFPGGTYAGHKSAYATYSRPDWIKADSWAHLNNAQQLENGNVLVSLRNFDLVVEVDRGGKIVWSFGPGILRHQHTPRVFDDGTMGVFDNGNSRAIVMDRQSQAILKSFAPLVNDGQATTAVMGEINLLADGNYKIVSSLENIIRIVSPDGEELWRMTITTDEPTGGIYRAHLPGLEN